MELLCPNGCDTPVQTLENYLHMKYRKCEQCQTCWNADPEVDARNRARGLVARAELPGLDFAPSLVAQLDQLREGYRNGDYM